MARVAVVGAGAIGSVMLAALAARGGHELVACVRRPFERLVVDTPEGPLASPLRCETEPGAVTAVDLVLLCVKAHQTAGARPWLEALVGPGTVVAVLQNGIEHRERLAAVLPDAVVAPAMVACPARLHAPGRAELEGKALLVVPDDEAGRAVVEAFAGSRVEARTSDDWRTVAWRKLVMNAANGAITVLARKGNEVFADAEARALLAVLAEEAASVGRAEGAKLPDDIAERMERGMAAAASGHMSSITVDRIQGRTTEWQARNEVVVRLAERHGIEVPMMRALTTLLRLGEPEESG